MENLKYIVRCVHCGAIQKCGNHRANARKHDRTPCRICKKFGATIIIQTKLWSDKDVTE